jgi:hypothetical protein
MGRPLTKETLSLLRPTANVEDGSSELQAVIVRQESSTGFTVQTTDGEATCHLTYADPQPGEMRLKAFIGDNSSYYVTHISDKLVTLEPDTGSELESGSEVAWSLYHNDPNAVTVQNKTNWSWFAIYNTFVLYNQQINSDMSMYMYGIDPSSNPMITKINNDGSVDWSVTANGIVNPGVHLNTAGITDYDGNSYVWSGDGTLNLLYLIKISSKGEIIWQKQFSVPNATFFESSIQFGAIDSKNNFIAMVTPFDPNAVFLKFSSEGNLLWQKITSQPVNCGVGSEWTYIEVLSDDSILIPLDQSQPDGSDREVLVRLDSSGNMLSSRAWNDTDTNTLNPWLLNVDNAGNMYTTCSIQLDPNGSYSVLQKISPMGETVWAKSYGTNTPGIYVDPYYTAIDQDANVYITYIIYDNSFSDYKVVIAKWDSNGQLLWQRLITSSPDFSSYTINIQNNHLYVVLFNIYEDNPTEILLRVPLDGDCIGSYTDPSAYEITDAAVSGYGLLSNPNIVSVQSNVSVIDAATIQITNSNLTLVNTPFGYEFGYK